MANEQNLIPFSERSKSEAREKGKKGGRASGAARRRKSQMRKDLERLLATVGADGKTYQCSICEAMISKALAGDVKAAEFVRDTIGEKPTDKLEANVKNKTAPVIVFDIPKPDDVPDQETGS